MNVTGAGGLNQAVTPVNYTANTNVASSPVTASATYAGDDNHTGSSDTDTFAITKAPSVTTVTCPVSVVYDGPSDAQAQDLLVVRRARLPRGGGREPAYGGGAGPRVRRRTRPRHDDGRGPPAGRALRRRRRASTPPPAGAREGQGERDRGPADPARRARVSAAASTAAERARRRAAASTPEALANLARARTIKAARHP